MPARDLAFVEMSQGLHELVPTEDSYTAVIPNTAYVEYILLLRVVRKRPVNLLENLLSHPVNKNITDIFWDCLFGLRLLTRLEVVVTRIW